MKGLKFIQGLITTGLLLFLGFFGGYYFGVSGYEIRVKRDIKPVEIVNKERAVPQNVDFTRFWEIWDMLNAQHIRRPLNAQTLLDGAVKGMVDAVGDPYSGYFNIEKNKVTKDALNGKYEGIGAQLGYNDQKNIIVVAPLDGSPAQKSGILAGDIVYKIDGVETTGLTVEEAVSKIRGEAGKVVKLALIRQGVADPFDISIVRATITLESVKWEDKGDGIAYIRLSRFGDSTNTDWSKAVSEILSQMPNLNGIVLDVRNNPGGYLDSAVYIISDFVDSGVAVTEDFGDGRTNPFKVNGSKRLYDKKISVVVLINEGSASASEIVAAALKESRGASLVGMRSFGKGSVQTSREFEDGAGVHITVAKWLTPDENWIDGANSEFKDSVYNEKSPEGKDIVGGLKPDFEVKLSDEDIKNSNDVQLQKALEIVKE